MNNINIEHIKGRDLVDALNNAEELIPDHYDELYGCEFTYESQEIKDDFFVVRFAIEHGHYIKDNNQNTKRYFYTSKKTYWFRRTI